MKRVLAVGFVIAAAVAVVGFSLAANEAKEAAAPPEKTDLAAAGCPLAGGCCAAKKEGCAEEKGCSAEGCPTAAAGCAAEKGCCASLASFAAEKDCAEKGGCSATEGCATAAAGCAAGGCAAALAGATEKGCCASLASCAAEKGCCADTASCAAEKGCSDAVASCAAEKGCCAKKQVALVCPVSGEPASKTIFASYNGGKVYLRCNGCKGKFEKDAKKYATKANFQLVSSGQFVQKGCPVAGSDKVNKETEISLGDVKVAFCCKGCQGKVAKAEPEKQIEMVFGDKAFEKAFELKKAVAKEEKEEKVEEKQAG